MATLAAFFAALALPGFSQFATGPHGGTVWTGVFPGTERAGFVYLPPSFDPGRRYPVIYLLHGMPGSPSEYLAGTNLLDDADDRIADGELRPFIGVMPAAGPSGRYNGEWAGPWERALVDYVVPWVDAHLPTVDERSGRTLGGLSAGGFGAVDIALRNSGLFGAVESWSGYFRPLRDGPFKHATKAVLRANDPTLLAVAERHTLADEHVRFFLSTGPYHSHWFRPADTASFARELRRLKLPVRTFVYAQAKGEWAAQVDAGLTWAFGG